MEAQPRGRSPSGGNRQHISPIPSPHNFHDASTGLDPAVGDTTFTTGAFNTSHPFTTPYQNITTSAQSQQPTLAPDSAFYSNNQFNQGAFAQQDFQNANIDPSFQQQDFMFSGDGMANDYHVGYGYHPMQQTNVNPADLSKMSSPQDHTSPNLLSPDQQTSPGQPGSPASTNGQYYTPQHSRNQSLEPSAAYVSNDWQGMNFPQHRRAPSDHSEVSSNAASPYVSRQELYQQMQSEHSPYLVAQTDAGNSFAIENISLNDHQRVSPAHSPYVSPRLLPSQGQGLGLGQQDPHQIGAAMYPPQPESTYPSMGTAHARNQSTVSDMGQADQYAPPSILIEPAPVSRQGSFGPDQGDLKNSLSPPGSRGRSKSDATNNRGNHVSRSSSPLGRHSDTLSVRSHSPGPSSSRGSSPGPDSGRIEKNRRASTSSVNSRDYILDLADPSRPSASQTPGSGTGARVQKHPATFQCHLCPKRFTRAYNLRSHLRTHTDERPFVCTVCGKAFARQHDRKRHESLHSGEKKFVCRGELRSMPGQQWGCGRRFARADALGRHFRSEAGRVCIKPLLDEEAAERRGKFFQDQQDALSYANAGGLQPVPQPLMVPSNSADPNSGLAGGANGGFILPAALLAQYPALQNIDWTALANSQQGGGMMDEDDDQGELSDYGDQRSSFDAGSVGGVGVDASGNEFYDDGTVDAGYVSGGSGVRVGMYGNSGVGGQMY